MTDAEWTKIDPADRETWPPVGVGVLMCGVPYRGFMTFHSDESVERIITGKGYGYNYWRREQSIDLPAELRNSRLFA